MQVAALTLGGLLEYYRSFMASESRFSFCRLSALVLLAFGLVSCSSAVVGSGGTISKVKYYYMNPGRPVNTIDPAVDFERDYHLYGAITKAEITERFGNYYTIFWKVDDRSLPVKVRFEYRQANTGLESKIQEQEVTDIGRSNQTRFQVTGSDYSSAGRVTSWKVTIIRGNEELVSQQSYLWN